MVNGNAKGKRGELELAKVLREAGFAARRAQQYCGVAGHEDLTHDIPGVYLECKRVERLDIRKAYAQALRDSSDPSLTHVVAHRANRGEWLVTLSMQDFLALISARDLSE